MGLRNHITDCTFTSYAFCLAALLCLTFILSSSQRLDLHSQHTTHHRLCFRSPSPKIKPAKSHFHTTFQDKKIINGRLIVPLCRVCQSQSFKLIFISLSTFSFLFFSSFPSSHSHENYCKSTTLSTLAVVLVI